MTKHKRLIFHRPQSRYTWKELLFDFVAVCFAAWFIFYVTDTRAEPISSDLFMRIQLCESEGAVNKVGDDGMSVGIFQIIEETFYRLAKKARKNLVRRKLLQPYEVMRWENTAHQLMLAQWAFEHGWGHEWTCGRKVAGWKRPKKIKGELK